jgi:hypothetical protein
VKVIVPSALAVAVPCLGALTPLRVRVSPSRSLSLVRTAMPTGVSSAVVAVSSPVEGASFTAVIVTVTVPVAEASWPSLTV